MYALPGPLRQRRGHYKLWGAGLAPRVFRVSADKFRIFTCLFYDTNKVVAKFIVHTLRR